jgi:CRP/FNR family cyclic AMP-dependent transcriptional regulator
MPVSTPGQDRSIFFAASPEMRAAIDRAAAAVPLAAGVTLFGQGDAADAFFILDAGEIEISVVSAGGRKLTLEIMTPGEIFGEIGLFAGQRTATATALTPARLRRVRRADLLAAVRTEPDLALQLIDLLCIRLRSISEKLEERAFLPLPPRLASRILHLDAKFGAEDGHIPVSQSDLADFAGATREAVAKTLAGWRSQGWVSLSRGALRILDRAALREIVEAGDD